MLFLYLIIAAVLLSTYRRPIAVFLSGLLPYLLTCHFYYYVLYMHSVVLINAIEDAGMSLGENVTGTPATSLHP